MLNVNNLSLLQTEQINTSSNNIDTATSLEIVDIINNDFATVNNAIFNQKEHIAKAIDECFNTVKNGGRVFYIGAGTSGRLGVLDASEIPPTFSLDNVFIGIIAGGDKALRDSIENAEDNINLAQEELIKYNFSSKDILVGIAASGRTPYVIGGINYANSIKAKTIAIACTQNSDIGKIANIAINLITNAEVISGSTRLKAGTAQKITLNIISTGVAIKLGKVYNNLMVDVKASNEKLKIRCVNIFIKIVEANNLKADQDIAMQFLNITNFNIKAACIMFLKDVNFARAKEILNVNNNNLKQALK